MRHATRALVLVTAFAAVLVQAAPLSAEALPGVRFDLMPVGCRIHGTYSTGQQVIDEYIGKKGRGYIIRTTEGPKGTKVIRTTRYDAEGYMIRKDWAGGKWETFNPYSCFDRPGRCTYRYRNADGQNLVFEGKVVKDGNDIISSGGFKGEAPFPPTKVRPGPFNLGEYWTDGTTTFRVTRYENCGLADPSS